jgi:PAS domain S-box-containing protein
MAEDWPMSAVPAKSRDGDEGTASFGTEDRTGDPVLPGSNIGRARRPVVGFPAWLGLGVAIASGAAGLTAKLWWLTILATLPAALAVGSIILRTRQQAQEEIEHERFLVETLLDHIPDHIYFKNRQSRFVRINRAMAEAFKLENPDAANGKSDFDFFLPEHAREAFEDEQTIIRTGRSLVNREEKETWPDGSVTWVSTTKAPIRDKHGRIIGTFGISRDISARKRAEEALAQSAQELARSNRELEQFAYIASHDLQEPLRMIASYLQLLDRRYKEKLDPDGREFLGFAVDGAKRLQSLIHDLLLYSRVGRQSEAVAWINSEEVLLKALENLKFAIEESGARVTHGPLPRIMADPTEMTQLFQNLIGNAIKFRGEAAPEIHIAAELRKTPGHAPKEHQAASPVTRSPHEEWLFSVADNGIGIENEYFERIFVIFQRLHTRDEFPGTGIGLALCKRIVERHGGGIWVKSQPGKGSMFWFTIAQAETVPT